MMNQPCSPASTMMYEKHFPHRRGRLWYRYFRINLKYVTALALFLLVAPLLFACGPTPPATGPAIPPAQDKRAGTPAPASDWDSLVAEARKEGKVNIYGTALAAGVTPLSQAFRQRFGIDLEFVQGRPPEVTAKLHAERAAGLYLADIGHLGDTTTLMDIKPTGVTVPLDNLLVLPEVKDPGNWMGGKLPFADKDNHIITFMGQAIPYAMINTDLIKPGELTSFKDLLQSRFKGQIVFNDPTVSGPGPNLMAALVRVWGKDEAIAVFRRLAAQEPLVTRDNRMLMEWVARGKYPVALGQSMSLFSDFRKARAPVKLLSELKEPRYIGSGPGNILVFSKGPNPRAAQVYVNWLLSKEGSTVWFRSMEYTSRRVDVSREGLDTDTIPRSEDFFPDEEQMQLRVEMRKLSVDIFGKLMK